MTDATWRERIAAKHAAEVVGYRLDEKGDVIVRDTGAQA